MHVGEGSGPRGWVGFAMVCGLLRSSIVDHGPWTKDHDESGDQPRGRVRKNKGDNWGRPLGSEESMWNGADDGFVSLGCREKVKKGP